jgi:hypothetical protein
MNSENANHSVIDRKPLIVFDFDGVIQKHGFNEAMPFDGIVEFIHELNDSQKYHLAVCSFNPSAKFMLRHMNIDGCMRGIRAGANVPWGDWSEYGIFRKKFREEMKKSLQILDIILRESLLVKEIIFFDDDETNLKDVSLFLKNSTCHLVKSSEGLDIEATRKKLSRLE